MFFGEPVPSASVSLESMTPHVFCGSGGLSVVKTHRSIAFTSFTLDCGAMLAMSMSACALVPHVGYLSLSSVEALQSSSTPLPGYSSAPGFTSSGLSEQPANFESQQSPSPTVQPSWSSSARFGSVVLVVDIVEPQVPPLPPTAEPPLPAVPPVRLAPGLLPPLLLPPVLLRPVVVVRVVARPVAPPVDEPAVDEPPVVGVPPVPVPPEPPPPPSHAATIEPKATSTKLV